MDWLQAEEDLQKYLSIDNIVTYFVMFFILIISMYLAYKLMQGDNDRELIKKIKSKRLALIELVLALANIIEAVITAGAAAAGADINFAVRLGQHLTLSGFSIVMGFGFFEQLKQALEASGMMFDKDYNKKPLTYVWVIKQWGEAAAYFGFAFFIPLLNFLILLIYEHTFYDFLSTWDFSILSEKAQVNFMITVVHLLSVFLLGSVSFDDLKDKIIVTVVPPNFSHMDLAKYCEKYLGLEKDKVNEFLSNANKDQALFNTLVQIETLYGSMLDDLKIKEAKHATPQDRIAANTRILQKNQQLDKLIKPNIST